MAENPGAGGANTVAAVAQVVRRVALGDLRNVVAGGRRLGGPRLGGPDAVLKEKEVGEARKLKYCSKIVKGLKEKEKLLKEQEHRKRVEMEPPMLKIMEASDKLELEFETCEVPLSDKLDVPPYCYVPQKQASKDLNEVSEATQAKDSAESAAGEVNSLAHPLAAVSEERDKQLNDQSMLTKQETINDDDTSLKDMLSGLHRMDKIFIALEGTMDELSSRLQGERVFDERLSIERSKVKSLEQEIDQLRLQVSLLQSKLDHGDKSFSSTKVPRAIDTFAVDTEGKPKLNETEACLLAVEELKGQAGGEKKQPVFIEICDGEDTCMSCDDDEEPSLISNGSSNGEPGSELWQSTRNHEWFFLGNKLVLSSGMKKHLRELCGCVPPEIPFYIHQMKKSNLGKWAKLMLSARYISEPLLSCLDNRVGYAHFEVDGEDRGTVRVQLNADGRAGLTTGWENVVATKDVKVGDICALHFKVFDGVLKLSVYVFSEVRHLVCVR